MVPAAACGIALSPEVAQNPQPGRTSIREELGRYPPCQRRLQLRDQDIDITFLSPRDFGFDMTRWKEPYVSTFVGGFGWSSRLLKRTGPSSPVHHVSYLSGEFRRPRTSYALLMGYRFPEANLSWPCPGSLSPGNRGSGAGAAQCAEFSNLSVLLPEIYGRIRRFGDRMNLTAELREHECPARDKSG